MRNFQDTFETRKRSFFSAFSICMTVPLISNHRLYFSTRSTFSVKQQQIQKMILLILRFVLHPLTRCQRWNINITSSQRPVERLQKMLIFQVTYTFFSMQKLLISCICFRYSKMLFLGIYANLLTVRVLHRQKPRWQFIVQSQ